jgi:hypothetical protein
LVKIVGNRGDKSTRRCSGTTKKDGGKGTDGGGELNMNLNGRRNNDKKVVDKNKQKMSSYRKERYRSYDEGENLKALYNGLGSNWEKEEHVELCTGDARRRTMW